MTLLTINKNLYIYNRKKLYLILNNQTKEVPLNDVKPYIQDLRVLFEHNCIGLSVLYDHSNLEIAIDNKGTIIRFKEKCRFEQLKELVKILELKNPIIWFINKAGIHLNYYFCTFIYETNKFGLLYEFIQSIMKGLENL